MKRLGLLLTLVVSALVLLFDAGPASACTCEYGGPEEAIESADAIFSGRVMFVASDVEIDSVYQKQNLVGFWVSEVWKGHVPGFAYVMTNNSGAGCGSTFEEGREYLVYAWESSFGYSTGLCSGNKDISPGAWNWSDPSMDMELLGQGRIPSAWDEPPSNAVGPIEMAVRGALFAMAGFILAVGSILGYKRLRNR